MSRRPTRGGRDAPQAMDPANRGAAPRRVGADSKSENVAARVAGATRPGRAEAA